MERPYFRLDPFEEHALAPLQIAGPSCRSPRKPGMLGKRGKRELLSMAGRLLRFSQRALSIYGADSRDGSTRDDGPRLGLFSSHFRIFLNSFTGFFLRVSFVFLGFSLLALLRFSQVLPNSTEFYCVLLGLTESYRVSFCFLRFLYWACFDSLRFHPTSPSFTGFNWVLPGFILFS